MTTPSKLGLVIGTKVRLLKDEEPYYSGYAGNPSITIKKGTIGIIGATDVPFVYRKSVEKCQCDYFVCVDFVIDGVFQGNPIYKHNKWRCGVAPQFLQVVKGE